MLELTRDYFKLPPRAMFQEIQQMASTTVDILNSKGVKYQDLKSALVPRADRFEAGFIFDSQEIESNWYGLEVINELLPLFSSKSSHSVQCGDLLGSDQELIFSFLEESLVLSRSFIFVHSTAMYCVYLNNLTKTMLERLNVSLSYFKPYVGFIPCAFLSRARVYLSGILVNRFIKYQKKVIMGHEDDRPNEENVNLVGYNFEEHGLKVISLQSVYFDTFLSYKIERPVIKGFEVDTEISLNAISTQIIPIRELEIEIENAKYEYLKSVKFGKLKKAGVELLSKKELCRLIRSKVSDSYIYNLCYLPDHDVSKFNVMLEIPQLDGGYPTRVVVALEYQPSKKLLRLITIH